MYVSIKYIDYFCLFLTYKQANSLRKSFKYLIPFHSSFLQQIVVK